MTRKLRALGRNARLPDVKAAAAAHAIALPPQLARHASGKKWVAAQSGTSPLFVAPDGAYVEWRWRCYECGDPGAVTLVQAHAGELFHGARRLRLREVRKHTSITNTGIRDVDETHDDQPCVWCTEWIEALLDEAVHVEQIGETGFRVTYAPVRELGFTHTGSSVYDAAEHRIAIDLAAGSAEVYISKYIDTST